MAQGFESSSSSRTCCFPCLCRIEKLYSEACPGSPPGAYRPKAKPSSPQLIPTRQRPGVVIRPTHLVIASLRQRETIHVVDKLLHGLPGLPEDEAGTLSVTTRCTPPNFPSARSDFRVGRQGQADRSNVVSILGSKYSTKATRRENGVEDHRGTEGPVTARKLERDNEGRARLWAAGNVGRSVA